MKHQPMTTDDSEVGLSHEFSENRIGVAAYLILQSKRDEGRMDPRIVYIGRRNDGWAFKSSRSFDHWDLDYSASDERRHDELVVVLRNQLKQERFNNGR